MKVLPGIVFLVLGAFLGLLAAWYVIKYEITKTVEANRSQGYMERIYYETQ